MHKRYSVFYFIGTLASACAGILAYGLMQMDGIRGYRGWRWIFIIEGIMTCLIGIIGWFLIVGFPDDAHKNWHFLTERETKMMMARVDRDRGDAHGEKFVWKKFLGAGFDLKIWGFAWIFGMSTTVTYALAYFLPIILRVGMGFSVGKAQCLVAPPYGVAGIWM
jgi:MFS family permease